MKSEAFVLKNPHSVFEVLRTRPRDVLQVSVSQMIMTSAKKEGGQDSHWVRVFQLAKAHSVPIVIHQPGLACEARIHPRRESSFLDLIASPSKGLWLALDGLQDPRNLGAIFRTAAFYRVQGIVFPQDRSVALTAVVYDVAAGGVESVPFSIVKNLKTALEQFKKAGFWILGSSEHAQEDYRTIQNDRPWVLVLGSEGFGMRRLIEETCDCICTIRSPNGSEGVSSLNVSVAAGLMIAHLQN